MRRMWRVACALAALLLVAGCAGAMALGEDDDGSSVTLDVGQELTIKLPSNVTTGYSWQVVDDGGLEQVGEAEYTSPKTDAVGAGGTETFRFTAKTAGTGTIELEYRRPWESGEAPAQSWSVTVEVR